MNAHPAFFLVLSLGGFASLFGHDSVTGEAHADYDRAVRPPVFFLAQAQAATARQPAQPIAAATATAGQPKQAASFAAFAPRVNVRWDERFLFVESSGLPAHNMMVGITAWQQQVPLPQKYTGANAWQIPLAPVPAKEVISIKNRFLRGAIALAANGIPIFNPQNNRGEISAEIGELDEWGGHCGRADDYHYHAAPLHLQSVLGPKLPIAYALDGYPIFGLTEPDGSAPAVLDACNGHTTAPLGYHYHASKKYPYVNGGFHGEVVEAGEQVDPQPRTHGVREALPGLRGAKITAFESTGANSYKLAYELNGEKRAIAYAINADGTFSFEFQNGRAGTTKEVYTLWQRGGGGGGGERGEKGPRPGNDPAAPRIRGGDGAPPQGEGDDSNRRRGAREGASTGGNPAAIGMEALKKPSASFSLSSPEMADGGRLPVDYTGDGSGATLPLAWRGAPAGTRSYALVMDHLAPGNEVKSYWTMWDIAANASALPKNVQGIGKVGR